MKQWQIEYIIRFYLRLLEVLLSLGTESLFSLLVMAFIAADTANVV